MELELELELELGYAAAVVVPENLNSARTYRAGAVRRI
jgi:hypothetical protein